VASSHWLDEGSAPLIGVRLAPLSPSGNAPTFKTFRVPGVRRYKEASHVAVNQIRTCSP
jgi:hypothetical protein